MRVCRICNDSRAKCLVGDGSNVVCISCPVANTRTKALNDYSTYLDSKRVDSLRGSFAHSTEEDANDANNQYDEDHAEIEYKYRKPCNEDCDACRAKCNWYAGLP